MNYFFLQANISYSLSVKIASIKIKYQKKKNSATVTNHLLLIAQSTPSERLRKPKVFYFFFYKLVFFNFYFIHIQGFLKLHPSALPLEQTPGSHCPGGSKGILAPLLACVCPLVVCYDNSFSP
jgi:hypothetical protein